MSTHRHINKICCGILIFALILTVLFVNGEKLGIAKASSAKGYETRLFDTSKVHSIDIVMDDWDGFLETCTSEEYELCSVVIDNEAYKNVAIRAKGNTSLTQVKNYGNDRYSFKIEFDHYDAANHYYGLDKLSLNNIIQDNTYMKDYLTYQMMGYFGAAAPLCSYVYLTVNGEDWGLYLAVEGVEESFLERNYGSDCGELYKPDSQSLGGGRGEGARFDMDGWQQDNQGEGQESLQDGEGQEQSQMPDGGMGQEPPQMPGGGNGQEPPGMPEGGSGQEPPQMPEGGSGQEPPQMPGGEEMSGEQSAETANSQPQPEGKWQSEMPGVAGMPEEMGGDMPEGAGRMPEGAFDGMPEGMGGTMSNGMGSGDTSLIYTDEEYSSYQNIFENAKTDISDADKDRLIASLKQLNEQESIEEVVDVDEVIRYFVVHNFVCNFDSYTGEMIHNYYLYEKDGQLSMIPWDYNLAFGGFLGAQDATALVNYPIDTPVSGGTIDSRPMLSWIFSDEKYTEMYHQYFSEFIEEYFESGYFSEMIDEVQELISPYVEKDPTKFCTYEEFETGIATLKEFCLLRAKSVRGQLEGTIAATSDGQKQDTSGMVDASGINISDMGTMNGGGGMPEGGAMPTGGMPRAGEMSGDEMPEGGAMPGGEMPEGGAVPGGEIPEEGLMPDKK